MAAEALSFAFAVAEAFAVVAAEWVAAAVIAVAAAVAEGVGTGFDLAQAAVELQSLMGLCPLLQTYLEASFGSLRLDSAAFLEWVI